MLLKLHIVFSSAAESKLRLQRMENNGVIEHVTQATEWCAPLVPVLKKNTAKACICVNLKRLNESEKST